MKSENKKVVFYHELTDDVCDENIEEPVINAKYVYERRNWIYKFFEFLFYRFIIVPLAFIYTHIVRHVKIDGRKKLKEAKEGAFIFANHTNNVGDALIPPIVTGPKKLYVIVNPKNLKVKPFGKSIKMMGALPLPTGIEATKNFLSVIENKIDKGHKILIYPEAKIWPFYTGVRPFKRGSFRYPVKYKKPIYVMTTTYQKTKSKRLKTVIYIDGPFRVNEDLPQKEQEQEFEKICKQTMEERAKLNTFEKYDYRRITND